MTTELSVKNNFGVVESVNGGTVVVVDETSDEMEEVKGTVVELVVVTVTGALVDVVFFTSSITSLDSKISLDASNSVVASVVGKVLMLTLVLLVSLLVVASVTASSLPATSTFSFINVSVSPIAASKPELMLSEISFITAGGMVTTATGKFESFSEVVETDGFSVASLIIDCVVVDRVALSSASKVGNLGFEVALVVNGVVADVNSVSETWAVEVFLVSSMATEISLKVIPEESVGVLDTVVELMSGNIIPCVGDLGGISSSESSS